MTDDQILKALSDAVDDSTPLLDGRWDALAAGTVSDEDKAALQQLAASDPYYAEVFEAFSPREAALDTRITDAILAQQPGEAPDQAASGQAAETPPARPRPDAPTLSITEWLLQRWRWLLPPLVAAAAAAIFLLNQRPAVTLVPYSLDVRSGERLVRNDQAPATARFGPGSQLDLILRPEVDITTPVTTRAFIKVGETLTPLDVSVTRSDTGVFRLTGPVDTLLPPTPGKQTLIFAVGPPDAVPDQADGIQEALQDPPTGWQLLTFDLERLTHR